MRSDMAFMYGCLGDQHRHCQTNGKNDIDTR
ncbi:hypothetical protein A2U01_0106719, partial [Trifolium medium]|nr:hypothetical protein [Trifolium medium]